MEARDVPATLVSTADPSFSSTSASANGQSETSPSHSISDDGTLMVFVSTAYNIVAGQVQSSGGPTENVYLYNTATQTTTLVSHSTASATTNGNAASFNPVISGDGSTIAFFSKATDLKSGTFNSGTVQLYLYNVSSHALTLVTHTSGSSSTGGDAVNPILPTAPANDYGAVNTLGYSTGIDLGSGGGSGLLGGSVVGGGLDLPSLSSNGKYVAFISNATNLGYTVPADDILGKHGSQVFLYDRDANGGAGQLTLVSHKSGDTTTGASSIVDLGAGPTNVGGYASTVAISADGSTVAYTAPFNNILSSATVNGTDDNLYVWSRIDNTTGATGLSAGKTVLASHVQGNNNTGGTITGAFTFGFTADTPPTLSDNGAFVAYYDAASDLVNTNTSTQGTPSVLNVFRYDVVNNTNRLVTHAFGSNTTMGNNPDNAVAPGGAGPAEATGPQISSDGSYIAYANNSSNLLASQFSSYDGRDQVYLWHATSSSTDTNTLVSYKDSNNTTTPNPTGATAPAMSANGRYVSYVTWAYPDANHDTGVKSAAGPAMVFDRDASSPASQRTTLGNVFDPNIPDDTHNASITGAVINASILAPTVMDRAGDAIAWDGSTTTIGAKGKNDTNGKLDVFFVSTAPPSNPTQLQLSTLEVPALNNSQFSQFQTTASPSGRVFQYTLQNGQGSTNNGQFTINNDMLTTSSTFVNQLQSTYSIRARTTDANYTSAYLDNVFQLTLVNAPTNVSLTQYVVPNVASSTIGQFQTTGDTGRVYQYTLVNGPGSTDNGLFTIDNNNNLVTSGSFPLTSNQTSFSIRVRSTDSKFAGLFKEVVLNLTLVTAPTDISLSTTNVPSSANASFATLSTTAQGNRSYSYSLVTGPGSADNGLFTIVNGDKLQTNTGFPPNGQTSFSIRVQSTDTGFSSLSTVKTFTLTLVNGPVDITSSSTKVPPSANTAFTQFQTVGNAKSTYNYSLVSGSGSTDNGLFTIGGANSDQLVTKPGFPPTNGQTSFSVRIRSTDSAQPALTVDKVFTFSLVAKPTNVTSTSSDVPALPGQTFTTFQTTGDSNSNYTYSLVTGPGSADNGQFTIVNGNQLQTNTGFPPNGQSSFSIRISSTDSNFPSLAVEKILTFSLVNPPASVSSSNSTIAATSNATVGTLSVPGSNRSYLYSLVSGQGSTDNALFAIPGSGSTLKTGSSFPGTTPATYSIRVRAVDSVFSSLATETVLTINVVAAPADPTLNLPSTTVQTTEGKSVAVNIDAQPGDNTSIVTVTVANVPAGVTFSAGTHNSDGTWTFTQAQLNNLTLTALDNATFTLAVTATAAFPSGGPTSSVSGSFSVAVAYVPPTIFVNTASTFNPANVAQVTISTTDPGRDTVQTVSISWGDGTVDTVATTGGTFQHQYAILNSAYDINVAVIDAHGITVLPGGVHVTAQLDSPQQAVMAGLFMDLIGQNINPTQLSIGSAMLDTPGGYATVLNILLNSVEHRVMVITDLYNQYLNRAPSLPELIQGVTILTTSGQRAAELAILTSDSFFNQSGGNNQAYANALYSAIFGSALPPSASADTAAQLDFGLNRTSVVQNLLTSPLGVLVEMNRDFQTYLHQDVDQASYQIAAPILAANPDLFATLLLSSQQYLQETLAGNMPAAPPA